VGSTKQYFNFAIILCANKQEKFMKLMNKKLFKSKQQSIRCLEGNFVQ